MKYVYLARQDENLYKVGVAINVTRRIKELQTSNPHKIEVVMTRLVEDAYTIEQATHGYAAQMRSGGGKEWFELTPEQAVDVAIHICKNPEINVAEEITVRHMLNLQNAVMRKLDEKISRALVHQQKAPMHISHPTDLEILNKPRIATNSPAALDDTALANKALIVFRQYGKASTSLMQRELRIGYGRASRVMDYLERNGKITAWDGQAVRQIL